MNKNLFNTQMFTIYLFSICTNKNNHDSLYSKPLHIVNIFPNNKILSISKSSTMICVKVIAHPSPDACYCPLLWSSLASIPCTVVAQWLQPDTYTHAHSTTQIVQAL